MRPIDSTRAAETRHNARAAQERKHLRPEVAGASATGPNEAKKFRVTIRHEIEHADRCGQNFSVLAFEMGDPADAKRAMTAIRGSIPEADSIGWLDEGVIGVLVRDLSGGDAVRFGKILRRRLALADSVTCTVYPHPPPLAVNSALESDS